MKVHHVGYAVRNIDKSVASFEKLGFSVVSRETDDEARNVKIVFMRNGDYLIELVQPLGEQSDVGAVIKKQGCAPYHICYEADNLESAIKELGPKFMVVKKPAAAPAIDGRRVAFLYSVDTGILEIVEK